MNPKSELAILRDQQLAKLREQTDRPERFTLNFACAEHDRTFRMTFARFSMTQRFRCESVDKSETRKATALEHLQALFRRGESVRVRSDDVDFASITCAWCAAHAQWTLCGRCKAFVCGARSADGRFKCRDSCGAQFETAPLEVLDGAGNSGTGSQLAIGGASQRLLTGRKSK